MPEKFTDSAAILTAIGTFLMAMFGRSAIDKDIRGLRKEKLDSTRFEDFKSTNETDHDRIEALLNKIFDKLDSL